MGWVESLSRGVPKGDEDRVGARRRIRSSSIEILGFMSLGRDAIDRGNGWTGGWFQTEYIQISKGRVLT